MMDEPFGALDAQTRASMQRLLIDTWRSHPTTVVFVTHDVDEALLLGIALSSWAGQGQPLRALLDVPEPREADIDRSGLRTEILAALNHTELVA